MLLLLGGRDARIHTVKGHRSWEFGEGCLSKVELEALIKYLISSSHEASITELKAAPGGKFFPRRPEKSKIYRVPRTATESPTAQENIML